MFAVAISRTMPTAPARIQRGRRVSPTIPSSSGTKSRTSLVAGWKYWRTRLRSTAALPM